MKEILVTNASNQQVARVTVADDYKLLDFIKKGAVVDEVDGTVVTMSGLRLKPTKANAGVFATGPLKASAPGSAKIPEGVKVFATAKAKKTTDKK